MRIVIVGGGIAGLSSYLYIRKHLPSDQKHSIAIYEAHDLQSYIQSLINESSSGAQNNENEITLAQESGSPQSTSIEEPVFTPEVIGSAIGISLNGLSALSRLTLASDGEGAGSQLIKALLQSSHPVHTWSMKSARGWKLIDVAMSPKKPNEVKKARQGGDQRSVEGIMISRQAFWRVLLAEVLRVVGHDQITTVMKRGRVEDVKWRTPESSGRVEVLFDDGHCEKADLVIGADGLRSAIRKSMFKSDAQKEDVATEDADSIVKIKPTSHMKVDQARGIERNDISWMGWIRSLLHIQARNKPPTIPDYITPKYEGLVGLGGFIPSSVLQSAQPPHPPGTMGLVFGSNGFFGYGYIETSTSTLPDDCSFDNDPSRFQPGPRAVYWSTFSSDTENPFPRSDDKDTAAVKRSRSWDFDRSVARQSLLARHQSWNNPTVRAIMDHIEKSPPEDGVASAVQGLYPTWTTPLLPTWHKGAVVLVGDAAHALQPSSGQGACQSMEDAEVLAMCLGHYLKQEYQLVADDGGANMASFLEKTLSIYEKIRMPRVKEIYDNSQRMSQKKQDMGFISEIMMYAFFKVLKFVGQFLGNPSMQRLLAYDLPGDVRRVLAEEEAK